jgi:hypothetical protein
VGTYVGGAAGAYLGSKLGGLFDGGGGNEALDTFSTEDKNNWRGTTDEAEQRLGNNIGAPQIGQQQNIVVGTDPNGEPIYASTGASVAAPTWQRAQTASGQAAQATGAQAGPAQHAQAAQAGAASMGGVQLDTGQANQTREAQNQLAGSLQQTASGQGPSVAQELLRQNTAQNINNQASAAQSVHGSARLAALRNASMTGAATQQAANSQASALRGQEIASAQGNLGNVLGTSRGQDVTTAAQNAALAQNTGQVNSGYQQGANLTNAQLGTQASQYNAGLDQQTAAQNATLAQNSGQYNANNLQNMTLANVGAQNASNLNFAQQQNAGNLSLAQANLGAQQGTNALNTQRDTTLIGAQQNMAGALTGIDATRLTNKTSTDNTNRIVQGNLINGLGQATASYYGGGGGE